jgi:hypothetical protein
VPGLVASRGFEVGARSEWMPGLQSSLALWKLDFDSELVYVGDAGSTEAEPAQPAARRRVEQPLGAGPVAAGRRRLGLDPCPFLDARPGW